MTEQSLEERKLTVIEQITKAFDGVSRGDGVTWHQAYVLDGWGDDKEQAEARKLDTETRWQDVSDYDCSGGGDIISFLDSEGYRYYLPAFMIWSLNNIMDGPESDNNTHDSIVYSLGGTFLIGDDFYFCMHCDVFTREQNQAIAAYLLFMTKWYSSYEDCGDDAEDAQLCLDKYWGQFLEGE